MSLVYVVVTALELSCNQSAFICLFYVSPSSSILLRIAPFAKVNSPSVYSKIMEVCKNLCASLVKW